MNRACLVCIVLAGCGSSSAPSPSRPAGATHVTSLEAERERRRKLAAAHRELEDEQATALAATCEPGQVAEPRCLPSCYAPEAPDARAGTKLSGATQILHLACTRGESAPFLAGELAKLEVRAVRGKVPKAGKQGSWQADVEAAITASLQPELARGDVVRVTGAWKTLAHPVSKERLRCVSVSHFVKAARGTLDACGARGKVACEAMGSAPAHGFNVVHYRLAEARQLQAAGTPEACQQAAREAVAVARGMPRWRQYASLNTNSWKTYARYRTRFEGLLDEDTLFTRAIELGTEAEAVHAACGGAAPPATRVEDEQSFHRCW